MERQLAAHQSGLEHKFLQSSGAGSVGLKEFLSTPRLPFGVPSGKMSQGAGMPPPPMVQKQSVLYATSNSFLDAKISSSRISQDDTQMTSQVVPTLGGKRATTRLRGTLNGRKSPSDRQFLMPGALTLDTDSEMDVSKLHIRDKLMATNTTRNFRNKTIDVPSLLGSELSTSKKQVHARSNLGNVANTVLANSVRKAGHKKHSMPDVQY